MKLKIKVREAIEGCFPVINENGDWFDLKAAETITLPAPQAGVQYSKENVKYRDVLLKTYLISLGVAMELPKGFEAIVVPRSSTAKKFKVMQANHQGVIDQSFGGNNDIWKFPAVPMERTTIHQGDRICQFRIQLSQKATFWQKLKWLFSSGVKFVKVDKLDNKDRNGFGEGTKHLDKQQY